LLKTSISLREKQKEEERSNLKAKKTSQGSLIKQDLFWTGFKTADQIYSSQFKIEANLLKADENKCFELL
jgi:hypothetical protein